MAAVGLWAVLVASVATLAVSAFVFFLDFRQRVHRAFALFLLLRAMLDGLLFFNEETTDLAGRLRIYWYLAVPFAALHFAFAYRRRHGQRRSGPGWLVPLLALAAALALETAYFLNHDLAGTEKGPGPLLAFVFLPWPVYSAIALLFAVERGRTANRTSRKALELAALGMSLAPLFFSSFELAVFVVQWVGGQDTFLPDAFSWAAAAAHLVSVLLLVETIRRLVSTAELGRRALLIPWSAALGTAGLTVFIHETVGTNVGTNLLRTFLAVWAFALPVCVTYALVKHRLFDAQVKLRFAVKGTTLAAFFVATFLVVGKLTESWAEQVFDQSWVVGAVAAGLLLFALTPLQRLADNMAQRALPGNGGTTHAERAQIYREQLEIAWADGRLTAKERLLFTRLQERLGISADEARRMENGVVESLTAPRKRGAAPAY